MSGSTSGDSTVRVVNHVTSTWLSVAKFLVLILGAAIIVSAAIVAIVWMVRPAITGIKVTPLQSGAQVLDLGRTRTVQWLYSASSKPYPVDDTTRANRIWSNSGIQVSKDETVKFFVSGAVNLAIHHLVQSARTDLTPYFHWIGPDGLSDEQKRFQRGADSVRVPHRIAPGWNQGLLMMQVVPAGKNPWLLPLTAEDRDQLYPVGSGTRGEVKILQSGTLYFSLNEVPLGPDRHDIYVITKEQDSTYVHEHSVEQQESTWVQIVKNSYWDLWYDDNVGSFLIVAEIKEN